MGKHSSGGTVRPQNYATATHIADLRFAYHQRILRVPRPGTASLSTAATQKSSKREELEDNRRFLSPPIWWKLLWPVHTSIGHCQSTLYVQKQFLFVHEYWGVHTIRRTAVLCTCKHYWNPFVRKRVYESYRKYRHRLGNTPKERFLFLPSANSVYIDLLSLFGSGD